MFRKTFTIIVAGATLSFGLVAVSIADEAATTGKQKMITTETRETAQIQTREQAGEQIGEKDRIREQKRDQTGDQDRLRDQKRDQAGTHDNIRQRDRDMTHDGIGFKGAGRGAGSGTGSGAGQGGAGR